jgi:hypothetical protein
MGRSSYGILMGNAEGRRPLGRQRRRWAYDIKVDLREIGWDGVEWTNLVQDREQRRVIVNTVMIFRV